MRERLPFYLGVVGAVASLVAGVIAFVGFAPPDGAPNALRAREEQVAKALQAAMTRAREAEADKYRALVNDLRRRLVIAQRQHQPVEHRTKPRSTSTVRRIQALDRRIDRTNRHVATASKRIASTRAEVVKLDNVILTTPDKALSVPLLRRDLDNQIAAGHDDIAAVENDVNRQYDLMKWILGSLGLGVLAMVGSTVIPTLRRRSPPPATAAAAAAEA
jgi:hypothetical protein